MSAADQRSALAALDTARPVISRLDATRHPEDAAADLIEGWSAVETALRSLMGGSALAGQALIRELRQRQLLSLEQAHALVEFNAAAERARKTEYRPTTADIAAARHGFHSLESGLAAAAPAAGATVPTTAAAPYAPVPEVAAAPAPPVRSSRRFALWAALGLVLVVLLATAAYMLLGPERRTGTALARGEVHYREGRREAARGEFTRAARDNPESALPHIYLGRIAREEGNPAEAREHLEAAIRIEPENGTALREMGSLLFSLGNFELARRFYTRAVEVNPNDAAANGYLGCTLIRLGRQDVGMRFLQRAGQGPWTACASAPPAPRGP